MSLWYPAFWEAFLGGTLFARMEHGTGAYGRPEIYFVDDLMDFDFKLQPLGWMFPPFFLEGDVLNIHPFWS